MAVWLYRLYVLYTLYILTGEPGQESRLYTYSTQPILYTELYAKYPIHRDWARCRRDEGVNRGMSFCKDPPFDSTRPKGPVTVAPWGGNI